ncbi:MAG: GNAT family N-acetyltransferase [Oscillospiraceae bacterium]|nr:GNAT family N-acetyltransferase [Oscillospiraceae bacterium]MCL2280208.1 GNAT family N-acetyltransferase [Oscillospiraceae bacterium]
MNITKENLTIRDAVISDAAKLGTWWRDGEVMVHAGFPKGLPITDEEIAREIEEYSDKGLRVFIIEVDSIPIGEMNYRHQKDDTASIGIKICETSMQGKGYGTTILKLFIEELFNTLGYDRITLDTNLNNKRAQHTYEKIGFQKTGVRYDCWTDQMGESQSVFDYELLKSEYQKQREIVMVE